jgi:hypothetical protein
MGAPILDPAAGPCSGMQVVHLLESTSPQGPVSRILWSTQLIASELLVDSDLCPFYFTFFQYAFDYFGVSSHIL